MVELLFFGTTLDGGVLSDKALYTILEVKLQDTVADMWDGTHGWKWNEFVDYLPPLELQKISSYSLCHDPDLPDSICWKGSNTGKFTIKSALGFLRRMDENPEPSKLLWRVIWRLPVPQRVRMFIWLAAHGRLMTNTCRVYRNMGDDPTCPRCSESDEDLEHLLRSCPTSRCIWSQVGGPPRINSFFTIPLNDWLEINVSNCSPNAHSDRALEFCLTCWWIWKWRNNVVFWRSSVIPLNAYEFLVHQFVVTKHALDRYSIFLPRRRKGNREVYIRWALPPDGWVKLNTDGASRGNPGNAGSGGIFRDATGNFLSPYFTNAGHCTSMRAELRTLALGLLEAHKLGYRRLLINMDNTACISLVQKESLVSSSLRGLVAECQTLLATFDGEVYLEHCYREANTAADWLANKGVIGELKPVIVMLSPAPELLPILRNDVTGVSIPRILNI